jgi:predicted metal-dependent hydrolase
MELSFIINAGGRLITYEITRKKVKNLTLRVKPEGQVIVSADNRVSEAYIEAFIRQKADWICKALDKARNHKGLLKKEIIPENGRVVLLLGREFTLLLQDAPKDEIQIKGRQIIINTRHFGQPDKLKRQWQLWYDTMAKNIFHEAVTELYKSFEPYGVTMPVIRVRNMKSRWGSCSVYGETITLNKMLLQTPYECIRYVAAHELTHFIEPNHSKSFYSMLQSILPEHRAMEGELKNWRLPS